MNAAITVHTPDNQTLALEADPGLTLAQALVLCGHWRGVPLCSGLGRCGLCRVRFLSDAPEPLSQELRKLGPEALAQGWRLACLQQARTCEIMAPRPVSQKSRTTRIAPGCFGPVCLAVDLGTTSLHWSAWSEGTLLARGVELNPQAGLGAEVMSRLAFAARPGGADILRRLVTDRLSALAADLPSPAQRLVVAGNPAMIHLLLGLPTDGLRAAPYRLDYLGGDERHVVHGLPPAYVPPLLAPFVGADLSAGLTALALDGEAAAFPFVLADLGTNGEFVLALSPDSLLCASVPMGPALEGVGLAHGRTAGPGVIGSFDLTPQGLAPVFIEGPPPPGETPGISGPAYLGLLAILAALGIVDATGRFARGPSPLAHKLARGLRDIQGEPCLDLGHGLELPASDVEEILKVKAAFNLALWRLLDAAGLTASDLAAIHMAGAFGGHVRHRDLEALGFLPQGAAAKTHAAGNTSLRGAELACLRPQEVRTWLAALPARTRHLDLTADPGMEGRYLERMVFRYV